MFYAFAVAIIAGMLYSLSLVVGKKPAPKSGPPKDHRVVITKTERLRLERLKKRVEAQRAREERLAKLRAKPKASRNPQRKLWHPGTR